MEQVETYPNPEYFAELQEFHEPTAITADMLGDLPAPVVEALRAAIWAAGYDPNQIECAEFDGGRLRTVTIVIPYNESE